MVQSGVPAQPLIVLISKQSELELEAGNWCEQLVRSFSLDITAAVGINALFQPSYLFRMPLLLPLLRSCSQRINRNALKAEFANVRQIQTLYNYERTILNAYLEVSNQPSKITNLQKG
jgi:hypothetical protein